MNERTQRLENDLRKAENNYNNNWKIYYHASQVATASSYRQKPLGTFTKSCPECGTILNKNVHQNFVPHTGRDSYTHYTCPNCSYEWAKRGIF
jgi:predicted RNA-binding Zn-ribbon protein involved in translation (DUF1610 family)